MAVSNKRVTLYLDPKPHEALQRKAMATDRTISDLIKEAIREDRAEEAKDLAAIQARAGERGIPFEEVVQDLRRRGKI